MPLFRVGLVTPLLLLSAIHSSLLQDTTIDLLSIIRFPSLSKDTVRYFRIPGKPLRNTTLFQSLRTLLLSWRTEPPRTLGSGAVHPGLLPRNYVS
ncbi:hypothetical protein GALMADRAFT_1025589 [Galerina marginata CBS 339.88]|uniref:Secreted protein n=1 Tax=Galerina marginata (strain CBS 339.88) TaxID=685588 RepID=A0A067SCV1_GALM3|nr:hypothetical protein GALMADRAFT_1025589 [Galerina marginata CBS 339.88]